MNDLRTDLVCELIDAHPELYSAKTLMSSETEVFGVKIRRIVLNEEHAQRLGRRAGRYHTLECKGLENADGQTLLSMIRAVAEELEQMVGNFESLMIAGLGNGSVTPDALGPRTVANVIVSRHIKSSLPQMYEQMKLGEVSALAPGVLGQTGVESADIIRAVSNVVKPSALIVIDSLAAMDRNRLCSTVQLSDAGITPGSGIGNRRFELSGQTMGVPVIAVGIPMVITAAALSGDGEDDLIVTPKSIDLLIGRAARLLGYAINRCAHKGMSVEDMDSLLS
jgi:spore protease